MKHTRYFKVKTGYGKDDFISIDETELPRALRAQITGKIAMLAEGTVAGNHIMSITPDYNRVMGYNRDYQLTGEDYAHIGREITEEHRRLIETASNEIYSQLDSGKKKLK